MRSKKTPLVLSLDANEASRQILEYEILGTIIGHLDDNPGIAKEIFEICPYKFFLDKMASPVAKTINILIKKGKDFNSTDILQLLNSEGLLENIARPVEVVADLMHFYGLVSTVSLESRAIELAQETRKKHAGQELQLRIKELLTFGGNNADYYSQELKRISMELEESPINLENSLEDQLEEYINETLLDKPKIPTKTPWIGLDKILRGGILGGELAVLAARPSVGKSAFALNFAYSVACSCKQALFFSLEMSNKQLFDRLVANISEINVGDFREGLSKSQHTRVQGAVNTIKNKKLVVYDQTKLTLSILRRKIRASQKQGEVGVVVIDYLQLMTPEERNLSREREVAEISRGIKLMAKELGIPILLLAQLNRKSEENKREPLLSDLRESGAIEQDADIVMFLHTARKEWHPDEPVEVIVAKGRSSGIGKTNLKFMRKVQRFVDSSQEEFEEAERKEDPHYDRRKFTL